ncbi:MAG: hypothetical protein NTY76_07930 [Candidatus Omnitrophica bacterium]|nr:hypothetical protein [Candidatus Omnitrophota bacterium]
MGQGNKTLFKNVIRVGCLTAYTLITLSAGFILPLAGAEERLAAVNDPTGFSILEAEENGMFNIGPAIGGVDTEADASLKKNVFKFDYTIFPGAIVGLWTKTYPAKFRADIVDAVKAGVKVQNPVQLDEVTVKLEIKGDRGVQSAPVHLEESGWSYINEQVDWERIGKLTEVVFVVSPKDSKKRLEGIIYFDLNFYKLTFLQKYVIAIKAGLVLLAGLILALIAAIAGMLFGKKPAPEEKKPALSGIGRDILYGIVVVMTLGAAMKIYYLGMANPLNAGFSYAFLAVGLIGVLIAEVLKFVLAGRHLTAAEVFQNVLVSGLLAASSSRFELLQAPASWVQLLMLSNLISALAFIIYHFANARSIVSSGRHLKVISGSLIAGTPYLFNWLLLLGSVGMLRIIGNGATFGLIATWPAISELTGRLLVMFVFNEIVTNSISIATKNKVVKTLRAHLIMLLVSLGVVIAPVIANFGSGALIAKLPMVLRAFAAILTTALSYGGLWGEVYLITGALLDAGKHIAPSADIISKHVSTGIKKGMAYSAILMGMMYALSIILNAPMSQKVMTSAPIIIGIFAGAALFPLVKTIIESFDGSIRFFERVKYSYEDLTLCARGAVAGFGFAYMATNNLFAHNMPDRILFGLLVGLLASGGVSILRDGWYALRGRGKIQSWRLYFVDSLLGIFVGSAAAFYMDSLQVPVVVEKFRLYLSSNLPPADYITYPLVNKWGRIDLGSYTGGVKLLYTESVAGVINWSIAAWLFAINKVFLQAFFEKDKTPIKFFFSKAGFAQLIEHMIYVLRWGLWMSPIIFTFLRMMPDPTWYNQDGAIHTVFAVFNNMTMTPEAFRAWSLQVFVWILALDWFRILIWMDHMGLRVATLVNLSFIGMDRLDERIGRFIGPASAQRYIPEGVKRFATWAPLLIPFYLPRGKEWDYAWNTSVAMQNASEGKGILFAIQRLALPQMIILICSAILACTVISFVVRALSRRSRKRRITSYELVNREYKVVIRESGDIYSEVTGRESDVSRRSYDTIDPCGRILYVVDASERSAANKRAWPVVGNFPAGKFEASNIEKCGDAFRIINTSNGVKTTVEISLPDQDSTAEVWKVTVENMTDKPRQLKVVPYLEWVLNGGIHDRFHTQYARLYPEMEYISRANAVLSWQKATKSMGILASEMPTEGFTASRVDFIGRARSIWNPRIMDNLDFMPSRDTSGYPTFDPIGSLIVNAAVGPRAFATMRFMIGYSKDRDKALELIKKHLNTQSGDALPAPEKKKRALLIGHGEIPPGTPQPYSTFSGNGNSLIVHTPYTPRPIDHAMSNAIHSVMVTNRGLHTSCNGNSQQNRLTPDWADTVTREIPSEAIYLFDQDHNEWYSPTYHPLNDGSAKYESEFSVDGSAIFRMSKGTISTELTIFVPPEDTTGVYLLTVKNNADSSRRIRVSPYFQMVMGFMPEKSGPLGGRYDKALDALFYENPRNIFRSGRAFVSMSIPSQGFEVKRGRYFGSRCAVAHPFMVENGMPDAAQLTDEAQIAGLLGTIEVPAHGEQTVAIILGQADDKKACAAIIRKYKDIEKVRKSLEDTRKWWLSLMATVKVETNSPEFDRYQNWLKYQALAERIWARKGFYQTSGAYGFRDQLQDTVNLIWIDPALARKQIILHASQQFIQGDVFHWFFTLTDGRTAFSCRSHASDNPVWLSWGVAEYIRTTGDHSILDEMTSYVESEFPFAKLPKNKQGWGHLYHRTTRSDTVYRHCMRSIDLILNDRTGKSGLPLIQVGDWNDGLDEIGSEGRGESVWLGFFLYYILNEMVDIIEAKDGPARKNHYVKKMDALKNALEKTWREDRYLRAIHDDGTEIGIKGSGVWEIDALTASWAVISGINFERGLAIFNTALKILEKDNAILLGWPALREDTKPYLGRSSKYPEGVRENGMYCHGVQWLVRAARILAEEFEKQGNHAKADEYRATAYRLWLKISPIAHMKPGEIEIYGGQPNKQAADVLTNFEPGRMIWHGYTGAAGWMLRQAMEGVVGASLAKNEMILPKDLDRPRGGLKIKSVQRDVSKSPFK